MPASTVANASQHDQRLSDDSLAPDMIESSVSQHIEIVRVVVLEAFVIIQAVILLTLLYGVMGAGYEKVMANPEAELISSRAAVVDSCESAWPACLRWKMQYFHTSWAEPMVNGAFLLVGSKSRVISM